MLPIFKDSGREKKQKLITPSQFYISRERERERKEKEFICPVFFLSHISLSFLLSLSLTHSFSFLIYFFSLSFAFLFLFFFFLFQVPFCFSAFFFLHTAPNFPTWFCFVSKTNCASISIPNTTVHKPDPTSQHNQK